MPKFCVYGSVPISVTMVVEAETKLDAIDLANQTFGGLTGFVGNGGTDKLVGVYDDNTSLDADYAEADFNDAEPFIEGE